MADANPRPGRTRRDVLQQAAGAAFFAVGGGSLLAACGDDGGGGGGGGGSTSQPATSAPSKGSKVDLLKGREVYSHFVTLNREYYLQWHEGAKRAVEALGGVYKYAVDDQNAPRQIQQFEQAVKAGAKIFFNAAPDPSTLAPMAKVARDNKVYFTHFFEMPPWGSPFDPRFSPSEYFVSFFIPEFITIGELMADELAKVLGEKGNVVHITGFPGATPDINLTTGVKRGIEKYPGMKILASQPGNWLEADSREAMAGIIRQHGDQINGVIGNNDDCGIGAANALQEAGMKDVKVVTENGSKLATEYVLAGKIHGTVAIFPAWNAGTAAVRAIDAALGFKPTVPERMMWEAGTMITKDNAQGYLDYVSGPDPFDWPLMSRIAHPDDWDPQGPMRPIVYDELWAGQPKPKGWTYPSEIKASQDSGEFDKITEMYAEHYKKKIYGA